MWQAGRLSSSFSLPAHGLRRICCDDQAQYTHAHTHILVHTSTVSLYFSLFPLSHTNTSSPTPAHSSDHREQADARSTTSRRSTGEGGAVEEGRGRGRGGGRLGGWRCVCVGGGLCPPPLCVMGFTPHPVSTQRNHYHPPLCSLAVSYPVKSMGFDGDSHSGYPQQQPEEPLFFP